MKQYGQTIIIATVLGLAVGAARADTYQWIGTGDATTWTDGNNWSNVTLGTVGTAPGDATIDGSNSDVVYFADDAADQAWNINLDATREINSIEFAGTGDRVYNLNTDAAATLGVTTDARMGSGATADGQINVTMQTGATGTGIPDFRNYSLNADFYIDDYRARGLLNRGANGVLVMEGDQLSGGDPAPRDGEIVFASSAVMNQRLEANEADVILSLAVDFTPGTEESDGDQLAVTSANIVTLRTAGSKYNADINADRIMLIPRVYSTENSGVEFAANPSGGSGNVILQLKGDGDSISAGPIDFQNQSGARVDFLNTGDHYLQDFSATTPGGISGAGSVRFTGSGNLLVEVTNTYAGGTTISGGGTLSLEANSVTGLGHGTLPTSGVIRITSGTLDLNAYDQETEGLAGAGTVDTDGGTFKVTETLDPGDVSAVGALTINGGTLEIADGVTYAYHMDPVTGGEYISANDIDFSGVTTMTLNLAFAGGDVGVLQSDELVLFEYTGTADISGVTFQFLSAPGTLVNNLAFLNNSNITDTGTQIILSGVQAVGVPEPSTMALLLLGGLLLRRRFRKRI